MENIKIVVTSDGAEITSFFLSFDFHSFNASLCIIRDKLLAEKQEP